MSAQFFYDSQIRRYLIQFTRMFSGFHVAYGDNAAAQGPGSTGDTLVRVPVRYGDASRQAQNIIQQNSASNVPSAPLMTFYITGLDYDRPRMQDPYFVSSKAVRQRTYDPVTNSYDTTQGNAFTIERYMPAPYKLSINLDIWTTNTNQKMQILEQILPLFNPALEIQSTDNFLDWTSLSVVELAGTGWSSRQVPIGTNDPIDIATLKFVIPIWLTLPAKVKKFGVVEKIVANIFDANGDAALAITDSDLLMGTRQAFTPMSYQVLLIDGQLQILAQSGVVDQPNYSLTMPDSPASAIAWPGVLGMYGVIRPGISMIALEQEDGSEVFGTIVVNPNDDRFLLYSINTDTLPANTLAPIDAVIDPLRSGPGAGLIPAAVGQRYLLTEQTGSDDGYAAAWAGVNGEPLLAGANQIVEYNGTNWEIVFSGSDSPDNIQYVTNITTEVQYKWTGAMWVKSYQGLYNGGRWRLII